MVPQLKRATIQNSVTGNLEFADYRISKSAWLKDHDDAIVSNQAKGISLHRIRPKNCRGIAGGQLWHWWPL
ncbi:hypothetical protein BSL78_22815 [Apostichopus japonicus]|uniref:Uncharacterized protein n=1 Tax=Stichopus japonicus TaxID=307972 RepID=A0A2G8JX45_STIJA|nr:hypothetical protein BSL78_22815 [Apostichopus japonicus]